MKNSVDVREATHVKVGGRVEKIVSKRGINDKGSFVETVRRRVRGCN